MAEKTLLSVLVYSPAWPVSQALVNLCLPEENCGNFTGCPNVVAVCYSDEILLGIKEMKPDILVLDIPLRVNCGLLNQLRHYYPSLPVVVAQRDFLFSDRIVAEYFGHIWLKEYDALMAAYPAMLLQEHLSHPGLAGTECGGGGDYRLVSWGVNNTEEDVQQKLTFWLRMRLHDLLRSPRLCEVVVDGLANGVPPAEVGTSLSRSAKLVYHYRGRVMRALNITRHARDFIPSVTVKMKQDERVW